MSDMTVGSTPTTSLYSGAGATAGKSALDKDDFLNLLVTQMRYQDPSSPMDTSQMMAQTSQMAMVEQMTAMTTTAQESFALQMRMTAATMIGQQVTFTDSEKAVHTGTVDSTSFAAGTPTLKVGDYTVNLDAVQGMTATPAAATAAAGTGTTA